MFAALTRKSLSWGSRHVGRMHAMSAVEKVDAYLNSFKIAKRTRSSYRSLIQSFAAYLDDHPRCVPSDAVSAFLKERKLKNPNIKRGTLACYERTLRAFCRWLSEPAVAERFDFRAALEGGTCCFLPEPRVRDDDLRHFLRYGAKRVGKTAQRDSALLALTLTCGLSLEEIASVRCDDLLIDEDSMWLNVPQLGEAPIFLPGIAAAAVGECLSAKDGTSEGEPLVVVAVSGKTSAMKPADMKRAVGRSLAAMGYDPGRVFHGDSQMTVAGMMKKLSLEDQRKLAAYATRLYYSHMEL